MVGNPWSYRGHTLEWSRIRLLTKWDDIEIDYNASGIRTRKGDTYYELDGDTIISETTCGDTIRYYYGNGGIVGFRYNGSRYYYEKNLQSDIVGIYDANGNKVGAYVYDAWGNTTITTNVGGIATINPFRYRSYYFDSDLGLYYLKSRYYDAAIGRFINADSLNYLGANRDLAAYNLFAYCSDKPVYRLDSSGHFSWDLIGKELYARAEHTATFLWNMVTLPSKVISAEAGFGVGLGAEFSASVQGLDVTVGAGNTMTDFLVYDRGKFDAKYESKAYAGFTIAGIGMTYEKGASHSYFDDKCLCNFFTNTYGEKRACQANQEYSGFDFVDNITQVSAGLYCIIGIEATLEIDIQLLFSEFVRIAKEGMSYKSPYFD